MRNLDPPSEITGQPALETSKRPLGGKVPIGSIEPQFICVKEN